jgi:flavin reductase (DIM6/NTAB) family NADH-FMN oxidoreductase RutF
VTEHLALDPDACDAEELGHIFDQAIAPRPIALVSTLGDLGRPYLHQTSWYSSAAVNPPVQYFAVTEQDGERGELLLEQLLRHREFVLNAVDEPIARSLAALVECDDDRGDFFAAELRPKPSVKIAPYRVAESPAQMECRVLDVLPIADGASHLVFGAVVQFHVREGLRDERGRIDQRAYGPIGKLMDDRYSRSVELYRMRAGETA